MFTHVVTAEELAAFESFLCVHVTSPGLLAPGGDRVSHRAAVPNQLHVFLDPDIGIKLQPCGGSAAVNYIFGPELVDLRSSEPARLLVVFDQSLPRGAERRAMEESSRTLLIGECVALHIYPTHAMSFFPPATRFVMTPMLAWLRQRFLPSVFSGSLCVAVAPSRRGFGVTRGC